MAITVAQLGCGYWGPNLLRNLCSQDSCRVKYVVEPNVNRQEYVLANYAVTDCPSDPSVAISDPAIDAIVVATPACTHEQLVIDCLDAGKHVFVEKPIAMSTSGCERIKASAHTSGKIVMVGHTFLYNNAVHRIKELKEDGALGDLRYIYSNRLNLGQVRTDVNAWWNLAPHDVSILLYLMGGELPVTVNANGLAHIRREVEDVVFAVLRWRSGVAAHVHVSWLDPCKSRSMTVVGDKKMAVYDDVSDDKIVIYDRGFDVVPEVGERMDFDESPAFKLQKRWGDILMPRVEFEEPLKAEMKHFLQCIATGAEPRTGLTHASDTVRILEAGAKSMALGGAEVSVQ